MKQALLILLATVAGTYASASLKVRFGAPLTKRFIKMPLTVTEASQTFKWTETPRPENSLLPSLILYCHESRKSCVLFDDTGYIAGYQTAFPTDEYTNNIYDWEVQGFTKWTPSDDGKVYYATQIYFVSEEFMAKSKEERYAARVSNSILQLDGIWVSGFNGKLMKISKTFEDIKSTLFTKQACIPGMGRHYYYNMSESLECSAETMLPWFPLFHGGRLVAVGLVTYGQMPEQSYDVFERPPKLAVKAIVPSGPQCLYNLADNPGLVTSHIYFDVDSPSLNLNCILQ
ncbi:uncharacterized protein LOC126375099 [Pectinophora gossypiella]|uniref:uncharacterized protein LOC126375099 n=1 Tax=Pectinophora gossypiella TaxID=13191 RepID=UPI00214EB886|nr:uncharacterized protein LOC126375099 [Pectinophora gossypiella]